jgi:hypothetical protein
MNEKTNFSPNPTAAREPRLHADSEQQGASQPKSWPVFTGQNGLRTGWRIFIFFVITMVIAIGGIKIFALAPQPGLMTPGVAVLAEALSVLSVLIATAFVARFEHRGIGSYGLALRRGFLGRFLLGSLWGFVPLSLLMLAMYALHVVDFSGPDLAGGALLRAALLWMVTMTFTGIFEESFMRGYPLFALSRSMRFWPAALVTSVIFALIHLNNSGEAVVGIIGAFVVALVFCLMLRRTGDLWFPIGCHFGWNYGETCVFGVSDSGYRSTGHLLTSNMHGSHWLTGGSVGPEGSLLAFFAVAFMALTFHLAFPRVRLDQVDSPRFSWRP